MPLETIYTPFAQYLDGENYSGWMPVNIEVDATNGTVSRITAYPLGERPQSLDPSAQHIIRCVTPAKTAHDRSGYSYLVENHTLFTCQHRRLGLSNEMQYFLTQHGTEAPRKRTPLSERLNRLPLGFDLEGYSDMKAQAEAFYLELGLKPRDLLSLDDLALLTPPPAAPQTTRLYEEPTQEALQLQQQKNHFEAYLAALPIMLKSLLEAFPADTHDNYRRLKVMLATQIPEHRLTATQYPMPAAAYDAGAACPITTLLDTIQARLLLPPRTPTAEEREAALLERPAIDRPAVETPAAEADYTEQNAELRAAREEREARREAAATPPQTADAPPPEPPSPEANASTASTPPQSNWSFVFSALATLAKVTMVIATVVLMAALFMSTQKLVIASACMFGTAAVGYFFCPSPAATTENDNTGSTPKPE